jgi:Phytanoyl-CoA dioxygenase (PhyH)
MYLRRKHTHPYHIHPKSPPLILNFPYLIMDSQEPSGLTPGQLSFFDTNGYLLIPDALSVDTVSALLSETHNMLNEFSLDDHPMTKFSTGEGENAHVGDDYFLTSGDKVRFFFEESKLPQPSTAPTQTPNPNTTTATNRVNQLPQTPSLKTASS